MTVLVCPLCGENVVDDPDAPATNPDGTGTDTEPCLGCSYDPDWIIDDQGRDIHKVKDRPDTLSQDERRP